MGLLHGIGSQLTGLSGVLELSVTCSSVLLTFSNGWGSEATDRCPVAIPVVEREGAFQYSLGFQTGTWVLSDSSETSD